MTDKITEPVAPEVTDPAPLGPLSGDWHDDDSQVYDEDFLINPGGPVDPMGVPHAHETIKPCTRLIVRSAYLDTNSPPFQLLTADPNRKSLDLTINALAQGVLVIADSLSGCFNGQYIALGSGNAFPQTNTVWRTTEHTGPVWVYIGNTPNPVGVPLNPMQVHVIAVTE